CARDPPHYYNAGRNPGYFEFW
nr:immunoglobulin heavy chain junction region [Macaca mulatta]MOW24819.1 immunoglobulin heavy chain junction region [Macaca mulatta]MOW25189.1 immunoglobulin heavy chain junction region [Macaca mulatta]MOW25856.1 immunoglobulin heavy chain junction region [Macaca mulatta]MOW27052.1 immunoglobulin heavy chain junction region [Macaca mulatta]